MARKQTEYIPEEPLELVEILNQPLYLHLSEAAELSETEFEEGIEAPYIKPIRESFDPRSPLDKVLQTIKRKNLRTNIHRIYPLIKS